MSVLLLLGAVTPAAAGDATVRIQDFFGNVNRVLTDPGYEDRLPERLGALRALVIEMVDFGHAAEFALGSEWPARTRTEREEFIRLFTDLMQTSVFAMVGGRARIDNGLSVTYVGELDERDGVTVATSVLTRSGAQMGVGYRMARRNDRWMVRDVVVDGVSLVDNYRAQFQKVIHRSSYAGLVTEMRTRIAELGRPTEMAARGPRASLTTASIPEASVTAQPVAVVAPPSSSAPLAAPGTTAVAAPVSAPPGASPAAAISPAPSVASPAPAPAIATPSATSPPAPIASQSAAPAAAPAPVVAPVTSAPASPTWRAASETPVDTARVAQVRVAPPAIPRTIAPRAVVAPRPAAIASFWVQLGAFREVERAIQVVSALKDEEISMLSAPGRPLIRVLVGPFGNRADATAKMRDLRRRGYDGFVAEAN